MEIRKVKKFIVWLCCLVMLVICTSIPAMIKNEAITVASVFGMIFFFIATIIPASMWLVKLYCDEEASK